MEKIVESEDSEDNYRPKKQPDNVENLKKI